MTTWPVLKRAVMFFCCFLAVLSVGAKQQLCSFFAGLEEKGRAGRRVGWGAEGEWRAQKCQPVGTGPEGGLLASGMWPGALPV